MPDGLDETLYDTFLKENQTHYKPELKFLLSRLQTINTKTSARDKFFKPREGLPGDGVCALYDNPDHKLRLYCIRYGNDTLIIGGGGPKPPNTRTWQDDPKLKQEVETLIKVSKNVTDRISNREIVHTNGELLGDLTFSDNEQYEED